MCSWLTTVLALTLLSNSACAQAPTAVQMQFQRGLELCMRFARRELDDSIQYYGDQAGFRPTENYRVQRWTDPADPTLWVEVEADGGRMECAVRVSPKTFPSTDAAIDALINLYEPQGFRRSGADAGPFAAAWIHDEQDGLVTLTVAGDGYETTITP